MMKLHMASMPRLPIALRKSWAIGSGRSELSRSGTDVVAYDAAMKRPQPRISVPRTPIMIAMGADHDASDTSSDICAAESSMIRLLSSTQIDEV
jgi:hypothetical protein